MEPDELSTRLKPFCETKYGTSDLEVFDVHKMPGHAGFAYGFSVQIRGATEWFRALAAYKFAIITGFNLSLHRRGKRVDPSWEQTKLSMTPLIDQALELLGTRERER